MEINLFNVLAILWALLNIILFFKLWNATNNIETVKDSIDIIKEIIIKTGISKSPRLLYAMNKPEDVYLQLNIQLFTELHLLAVNCSKKYGEEEAESLFDKEREELVTDYEKSYKMINKEIPQYFKTTTLQQMQKINFLSTDYGI